MRIRKLLAFFLSMSLIVCSVPTLVFADETEAADDGTNESKVEEVVEAGTGEVVVDGEPAQNGQGDEDGNGDSGDAPVIVTTTDAPIDTVTPIDPINQQYSGTCGENANWEFDAAAGVLTISGHGLMDNYGELNPAPWYKHSGLLKTVSISSGIQSIGDFAFYNCKYITQITIPDSITSIGAYAFQDCINLFYITIPDSVLYFGSRSFKGCINLNSIKIPDGVVDIQKETFMNCSSLKKILIPESIKNIGNNAFYGCNSLTSVFIPNGVSIIESGTFYSCSSLNSITIPEGVTEIGNKALEGCSSLSSINIPQSVTKIDDYAFSGCSNLTTLSIPDSTIILGSHAFSDCRKLASIYCYSLPAYYDVSAFAGVPDNVMIHVVFDYYEYYCQKYSSQAGLFVNDLSKPANADTPQYSGTCGDNVNYDYSNGLLHISGTGNMYDGEGIFTSPWNEYRNDIRIVIIDNGIESIGAYAFYGCRNIEYISIPDTVTQIGESSFELCSSIIFIDIPNSVTSIGESAFELCGQLTTVKIPYGVISISKRTFYDCRKLTSVVIPDSVINIGMYAFWKCESLTSITLPDQLTTIGPYAFALCKELISLSIPESVTSLDKYALSKCENLEKLYVYTSPETFNKSNCGITKNTTIYVKNQHLESYKQIFVKGYTVLPLSSSVNVLGHRVGLGDQIGIDFFMSIPSGVNVDDLSVSFSWGTGNYAKIASGELISTTANGANYIASCAIAARCMTDTVTMTIKKGNTVYATSTFKVVDYVAKVAKNYPAENSSGSNYKNLTYNQKLHTLLLAMLDYGAESQQYFKYRTDDLASSYKGDLVDAGSVRSTVNSAYTTYDAATLSSFASKNTIMNIGDDKIGISYAGAAVACTSKTSFKFYFNKADGYDINSLSATYKGKALTFKEEGDSVTLEIAGLSPKEYAPAGTDLYDCSISLTINGKVYTYTYLDYVYKCNNSNHAFKNTAVALAAYSYFAANLEG